MRSALIKYVLFLVCLCWLPPLRVAAQEETPLQVERRVVEEEKWKQAAQALDYSRDVPEPEKVQKNPWSDRPAPGRLWNFNARFWGNFAQALAILLAVAIVTYGIYRMLQEPQNKRIARDGAEITVENLETYLHETDLDRFLREALERQDYSQAVRIYFLQLIKQLSESEAILWSKEKTNRDYLLEMRPHHRYETFRSLTHTFERIWYGNVALSAADFARIEPAFKSALQK